MGSLKSSPSTSTVKKPVIEPLSKLPARSNTLGSRLKTLGGYPFWPGGSPAARPISRCAIARRVTESITSSTLLPQSRKYSATAIATNPARMRSGAGWSEVATITTERLSPSALNSCSRNSRTSRLRSPISAITLTSAEFCRARAPNNVLLPTPEPPKIPTRWPLPNGSRLSMARTPVTSGSLIGARWRGPGGAAYKG